MKCMSRVVFNTCSDKLNATTPQSTMECTSLHLPDSMMTMVRLPSLVLLANHCTALPCMVSHLGPSIKHANNDQHGVMGVQFLQYPLVYYTHVLHCTVHETTLSLNGFCTWIFLSSAMCSSVPMVSTSAFVSSLAWSRC